MPVEFLEHQPVEFIPHADPNLPTGEGIIPGVGVEGDTGARQGPELIPPRPPPRDIATLPPVRFGQQKSMVGQALAGTANLALDVTSAFGQNPEYLMMSTRLGKAAMTIPALVQMGKLLPAEGANALLAAKQGDIQGTIQHGGAALLAALGIRQTLAPKATAALAEMQGPPVLGRMLETARGAPTPIIERPPLDLLPPEEAAGQASAMTRAATAAYEPPRQPRPKPEVPATPPEPYETVLQAIRNAKADTTSKVQALFPAAQLSRQQAADLRRQAFGQEKPVPPAAEPIMDKLTEAIDKGDFNAVRKEAQKLAVFDEVPESVFAETPKPKPTPPIEPPKVEAPPKESIAEGMAAWKKQEMAEMEKKGWNYKWPFVPADLMNKDFRDLIRSDPSLSAQEKAKILKFGPPEEPPAEKLAKGLSTEIPTDIFDSPSERQVQAAGGAELSVSPEKHKLTSPPNATSETVLEAKPGKVYRAVQSAKDAPGAVADNLNWYEGEAFLLEGTVGKAKIQTQGGGESDYLVPESPMDVETIYAKPDAYSKLYQSEFNEELEKLKKQYPNAKVMRVRTGTDSQGNDIKIVEPWQSKLPEEPPAAPPAEPVPKPPPKPPAEPLSMNFAQFLHTPREGALAEAIAQVSNRDAMTPRELFDTLVERGAIQYPKATTADILGKQLPPKLETPPAPAPAEAPFTMTFEQFLNAPREGKLLDELRKLPRSEPTPEQTAAKAKLDAATEAIDKAGLSWIFDRGDASKKRMVEAAIRNLPKTKQKIVADYEKALDDSIKVSNTGEAGQRRLYDRAVAAGIIKPPIGPGPGAQTAGEPPIIGMGGATPQEFMPGQGRPTSTKNAVVDQERAERGLPPMSPVLRKDWGKAADEAIAKMDADPQLQDKIIADLLQNPRPIKDWENYAVLQRRMDLRNELEKALRSGAQAYEDAQKAEMAGDLAQAESRRADIELAKQQANIWEAKLQEWEQAVGRGGAGTELGRGLAARKMMMNEDFSLASMVMQRRAAKGFEPLTDKEMADTVQNQKDIENTQRKLDEKQTASDRKKAEQAVDETIRDITRTKPKPGQEQPTLDKLKDKLTDKLESDGPDGVGNLIQRLARYFVETGIRERNALIDAVHDVVAPMIPEWTRRDTMDAISGYGKYKQLTKDEISVALRDLKGQMQQAGKIEDMLAGKAPLKTGIERRTSSDEERALIKEVNRLKAEANYTVTDAATQLKSRLQQWKTTLTHRIADYERRLREGDFATKKRPERKADAEVQRLQLELSDTKRRFYQAMERDRLARRTTPRKVFEGTVHTVNTARAIMTSSDLSAVLRQGHFIVMGHPLRGLSAFPDMLKAFASRQGQFNAEQAIRNHPLYAQAKASGLYLSEKYEGMSKLEEMYMTPWAEKIPIVAGSERAYTTFLNKLRMDSFAALVRTLTATGRASAVRAKVIANYVNVATGRGKIGAHDQAAQGLNTVFFAPRFVASRFQLVLGQPFYHGDWQTRKLIAGEYARYLAGIGVLYGLANFFGADVGSDPRSSDFGKIVVGNTRIDPLGGLQQGTVLMTRLGTGETMNLQGRITPIRGKVPFGRGSAADVIARFARSKLSPAFGTAVNLLAGTDYAGQPVTPASLAVNLVTPISLSDIYQAMRDLGVPEGMAVGVLSIFGMNLQTYNQ